MNFTSFSFLLIFPLTAVLFGRIRTGCRPFLLLAVSWLLYWMGNRTAFFLLLFITCFSFAGALLMEAVSARKLRTAVLCVLTAVILGILAFFKFGTSGGNGMLRDTYLPAGISFYTFQTLSYCVDVWRGKEPAQKNFLRYALFVSFFPQLVAGPIERAGDLMGQLDCRRGAGEAEKRRGTFLLIRGYFKKAVIADFLGVYVDRVYAAASAGAAGAPLSLLTGGPALLAATVLFSIQIYADFSGYSDIACGAAAWFGIRLTPNFNSPYLAESIREFWRRWHITLTRWFTDYVYIPMGGNRRGKGRQAAAILTVFALSGLWHGGAGHFLVWGCMHGCLMCVSLLVNRTFPGKRRIIKCGRSSADLTAGRMLRTGVTFLTVTLLWIWFRSPSVADAVFIWKNLTSGWGEWRASLTELVGGDRIAVCRMLLIPLLLTAFRKDPEKEWLVKETSEKASEKASEETSEEDNENDRAGTVFLLWLAGVTAAVAAIAAMKGGGENAFLYFRF